MTNLAPSRYNLHHIYIGKKESMLSVPLCLFIITKSS